MGAVDPERASEHTLQKMVDRVVEDRANLLQFIFYCDNDTKIEELKFVDDKRIEIKKKIQSVQKVATALLENKAADDSQRKANSCYIEAQNLRHLVALFDTQCLSEYAELSKSMDDLAQKFPKPELN